MFTHWAWAFATPVILFLLFVCPIWIVFHYLTVWKRMKSEPVTGTPGDAGADEVRQLHTTATRLESRMRSLETILDAEFPHWRSK